MGAAPAILLTPAADWILLCGCGRIWLCRLCGLLPAGGTLVLNVA